MREHCEDICRLRDELDELLAVLDGGRSVDPGDVFARCEGIDDDAVTARCLYLKGRFAFRDGDLQQATEALVTASDLALNIGDTRIAILSMCYLAGSYDAAAIPGASTTSFMTALDMAEQLGDHALTSRVYYFMASALSHQRALLMSLEMANKSLEFAKRAGDPIVEALARGGVGHCLVELGRLDEGLVVLDDALEYSKEVGHEVSVAFIEAYQIELFRAAGNLDRAVTQVKRSMDSLEEMPLRAAGSTLEYAATVYCDLGDFDEALRLLDRIDELFAGTELSHSGIDYFQTAARIHEGLGDYPKALEMLKRASRAVELQQGEAAETRLVILERHRTESRLRLEREIDDRWAAEMLSKSEQVQEMASDKEEILQVVAHDLMSPLHAISLLSESILASKYGAADNTLANQLQALHQISNDMRSTMSGLVLEEPKEVRSASLNKVSLAKLAAEVVGMMSWVAERKGITIELHLQESRAFVRTDEDSLRRILENLVSNAVKFSPWNTTVEVDVSAEMEHAVVRVRDFGPGIPEDDLGEVFAKRTVLSSRPTGGETSTGLGLYITERLADQMGATVAVTSQESQGSSFSLTLDRWMD